ncbi:MAG: hypothetical protein K6G47_07675 [Clostridia bacterium]|nr:hypothetical protein [Clostridia bacterium]
MGTYEDKCKYYENLYKPKSSSSGSSSGGKSSTTTKTTSNSPQPCPTPTPSSSSDSSYDEEEEARRIAEEQRSQVSALKTAVSTSKGLFNGDVSSINSFLGNLEDDSPIVGAFVTLVEGKVSALSEDGSYQDLIDRLTTKYNSI